MSYELDRPRIWDKIHRLEERIRELEVKSNKTENKYKDYVKVICATRYVGDSLSQNSNRFNIGYLIAAPGREPIVSQHSIVADTELATQKVNIDSAVDNLTWFYFAEQVVIATKYNITKDASIELNKLGYACIGREEIENDMELTNLYNQLYDQL